MSVSHDNSTTTPRSANKGFRNLLMTQFQAVANDHGLKNLVVFLILGMNLPAESRDIYVYVVAALFAFPFILFSMTGGYLADRFSKRTVTVGVKTFEVFVMCFALMALSLKNLPMEMASVCLMGIHSALWGPSKYGLLPELLPEKKLSWGNGILELGTFLAVISGMIGGGILSDAFRGHQQWSGLIFIGLALLGLMISLRITRVPVANVQRKFSINFLGELFHNLRLIHEDRVLWLALVGSTYFFFLAAIVQLNLIIYGKEVFHLTDTQTSYLYVALAIGIGLGSFAAGHASRGKIEYGLIPLGSLGLTVFALALSIPGLSLGSFAICVALMGFFGGFFIVPPSALLQHRPEKERKGTVLAVSNWLSFVGIFLASGVLLAAARIGTGPRGIFVGCALLTLVSTIYVLWLLPDSLLRFVLWLVTNSIYRIHIEGRDNIPEKGGALFVCNHVSLIDALFVLASNDRFVRFLMYKDALEKPLIRPFGRLLEIIPISSQQGPREMIRSLRQASDVIRRGEVILIFAEGSATRTGQMLPFRKGFERIMKDVDAPIIPVALNGVWGSIFSYAGGKFYWKVPRRIPYPITVAYGEPMSPNSTAAEVREAVQDLLYESWSTRRREMKTLDRAFVSTARHHPFRFAMADDTAGSLTFHSALTHAVFVARRLKSLCAGQSALGLLLPASVGAALVNCATLLIGGIPVNLNFTVGEETIRSCLRQCDIQTVITSKAFVEKLKLQVPSKTIFLEDVLRNPRLGEKIVAAFTSWFVPAPLLERMLGRRRAAKLDDLATIIFSSGSTGQPKGVMLSHYNIASNIRQIDQVFGLTKDDKILGILPFFHSFGFNATWALPSTLGIGVVYNPTPLDSKNIGRLVREYGVTLLMCTPTFLQIYLRGCAADDFGGLKFVMTGAEKLQPRLAQAFEAKFGILPMEGYGSTECGPVQALNTRDYRAAGYFQAGAKRGKIGHPLPGISIRIVDPNTWEPLPVGQAGLLLVRGPNLMQGYLGMPEKTAAAMHDGWYITGDIAAVDENGFLEITDRLSRFSKIGGEMVPHIKLEEKLYDITGLTEQAFAVTGVPDNKKGERLVVLHTLTEEQLRNCLEKLRETDLPNLWRPKPGDFYRVDSIPHLGTGKLDLQKLRQMALQFSATVAMAPPSD
jgi:acyl-[acyl-carrier-protein]-phospholipid O-acyltransferase / long-chain-fatty-acid--[acyl-carrier-protein] ligase